MTPHLTRPMSHDKPVTSLGQLALLEAKAQLAADLAATDLDRSIFRELAREASEVSKTVQRERVRRRAA